MQTSCPALPWCKAEGEWESTPGGQVAFAPCSSSSEGEFMGRKYRPCILKFVKKESIPTTETSTSTEPSTASTASTTSTTSAEEGASTASTTSTAGAEDDASTTSTTSAEADVSTASTTSTTSAEDGVSTASTTSTETTAETNQTDIQAPEGRVEAEVEVEEEDSFMEVAQWGDVVDTALFCQARPPKCSEILTNDGQTILALEIHDSQELRSTKCCDKDGNKTGRTDFDTYSCRLFGGVPSLERVKTCGQRCEDDDYCNGGKADFELDSVSTVRFCVCDRCPKGQSGKRCEIGKEKEKKKSNVVGTVIVVIAFLIIIGLCLGLCGAFKYCEKKKKKDEESQVRLPTPAKGLNSLE